RIEIAVREVHDPHHAIDERQSARDQEERRGVEEGIQDVNDERVHGPIKCPNRCGDSRFYGVPTVCDTTVIGVRTALPPASNVIITVYAPRLRLRRSTRYRRWASCAARP